MGQVIIWDIVKGIALRVFLEKCVHLNWDLFESNLWECCWSSKGDGLVVSTGLGTWSEFGYGSTQLGEDQFSTSEQFFSDDYERVVLDTQSLRVLDMEGNDWYASKDATNSGKKSVKQTVSSKYVYCCNAKMDPIENYSDEGLSKFNSRAEQIQWLSETPGFMQANRLLYKRYEAIDKDQEVLIPKS